VVHPIGTTTSLLDDGSMDDISEENEENESIESEENSEAQDAVSELDSDDLAEAVEAGDQDTDTDVETDADVDTQDSDEAVELAMGEATDDEAGAVDETVAEDWFAPEDVTEDLPEDLTGEAVAAAAATAGPPPPQYTQPSRLTRDPFARLGGVLSCKK